MSLNQNICKHFGLHLINILFYDILYRASQKNYPQALMVIGSFCKHRFGLGWSYFKGLLVSFNATNYK